MIKLYKNGKSCFSDDTTYMAMCLSGWSEHKEDIAKLEKEKLTEAKRLKDEAKKLAKNN